MSDDEFAAIFGAADQQLARAQACLDLFEKDRGRLAHTALDIRNWADVQDPETLRFRITRRLRAEQAWRQACRRIWSAIPAPLASRPPIGQRIFLTLPDAAIAAGVSERHLRDAITAGRLVAMKDIEDVWFVERDELCLAFPAARRSAVYGSADAPPLDATTLVLEVGIQALVRQAGGALRRRRFWWRRLAG